MRKSSLWEKLADIGLIPRSLLTFLDHSTILRNAGVATIAHPGRAGTAFKDSIRAIKEVGEENVSNQLKAAKDYDEIVRAGAVPGPGGKGTIPDLFTEVGGLAQDEAFFGTTLTRRLPGIGQGIKVSERVFNTYNNQLRYGIIEEAIAKWESTGVHLSGEALEQGAKVFGFNSRKAFSAAGRAAKRDNLGNPIYTTGQGRRQVIHDWTPEMANLFKRETDRFDDIKSWSTFVKHATGRGGLGSLRQYGKALSVAFFAPRWLLAQPQMFWDLARPSTSPRVRAMIARDMSAWLGVGMATLGVAAAGGAEVQTDPRSSQFGQIQLGNARVNIFGSLLPTVRYFAQLQQGERLTSDSEQVQSIDRWENTGRFIRSKLSPPASLAVDAINRENFLGRPIGEAPERTPFGIGQGSIASGIGREVLERTAPLIAQDVFELIDKGEPSQLPLAIAAFFGIGVNTYETGVQEFYQKRGGQGQLSQQSASVQKSVQKMYARVLSRQRRKERRERELLGGR